MKDFFISVLDAAEKNSTCRRLKVAALLVKNNRIISTGWNGVPSGDVHCEDLENDHRLACVDHHDFSEANELHAEQNCIAFAARNGISTDGAEIYLSISPCTNCAKLIIAAGIKKVYFKQAYDRSSEGLVRLSKSNIAYEKIQ
jgi:dCMP deaminase